MSDPKPCPHESSVGSSNAMIFGRDGCVRCLVSERDELRDALAKARPIVWREALDAAARVVRAEPEYPDAMPDEMFETMRQAYTSGDKALAEEMERITVRLVKKNIVKGIIDIALSEKS